MHFRQFEGNSNSFRQIQAPSSSFGRISDEIGQFQTHFRQGMTSEIGGSRNVHTGNIIHTDGWPAYRRLSELGYTHQWVNHSLEFAAEDGTHTQRIESQWRALRRRFSPGGIRHESIGDNLMEYMWRRKCKQEGRDMFSELVKLLKVE